MAVSRVTAAALAGLIIAAAWRLRRYEIAEESMAPALLPGDYVIAVRRPRRIRPGDVVIFEHPDREGFTLVKRVVSVTGGKVTTRGDNRGRSSDVGSIAVERIEARAAWVYWPPGRFGLGAL